NTQSASGGGWVILHHGGVRGFGLGGDCPNSAPAVLFGRKSGVVGTARTNEWGCWAAAHGAGPPPVQTLIAPPTVSSSCSRRSAGTPREFLAITNCTCSFIAQVCARPSDLQVPARRRFSCHACG